MFLRIPITQAKNLITRARSRGWGWYYKSVKALEEQKQKEMLTYDHAISSPSQRPKAFLDVEIEGGGGGRVVFELAKDVVPKTVDNFIQLCDESNKHTYKGTKIHIVQKGNFLTGGDVEHLDGRGGHSAGEDRYFEDENYALRFTEPGVIGMTNSGVDSNASQFFVALKPLTHLNGRNVAFGKVVEGFDTLSSIESVFCIKGKPVVDIKIKGCGMI